MIQPNMTQSAINQTPVAKAELLKPKNEIKQKAGSGGLDPRTIDQAQNKIENNDVDFKPIAAELLMTLDKAIADSRSAQLTGTQAIESIIYPVMQLKAQGGMFHYPLVTDIADILVNFMETLNTIDKDAIDIADAHKKTLQIIMAKEIRGKQGPVQDQFRQALNEACERYYKLHKTQ